ncbi:MAG TPA: DUF4388 domain-containing protein [Ktedonosporobacter sp.]|nr:DUF4388 domain-containing protein [Ktedonosporobacter sp.]
MTDSLADIIQLIQLGSRSGTLTVERGLDQRVEEGYIVFASGRVVEARVGQYTGSAAYNYLNAWGTCRFSFVSGASVPQQSTRPASSGYGTPAANTFTHTTTSPLQQNSEVTPYSQRSTQSLFPMRLHAGEAMLQQSGGAQLPRNHRRLLLLINGQRSVGELARLMARNLEEVQALLNELERSGLIQQ